MRFGIDLGGTKIELIALDDSGLEVFRARMATPQGDYAATLDGMIQLVQQAEATLGISGTLGIGTPGAVSKLTGSIKNSNSICLNGRPLREEAMAPCSASSLGPALEVGLWSGGDSYRDPMPSLVSGVIIHFLG